MTLYTTICLTAKNAATYDSKYEFNHGICEGFMNSLSNYMSREESTATQLDGYSISTAATIFLMILP